MGLIIKIGYSILLICLFFTCYNTKVKAQTTTINGTYVLFPIDGTPSQLISTIASQANVAGYAYRASWAAIEQCDGGTDPNNSCYHWSEIDNIISLANTNGKKISILVAGGGAGYTPSWVISDVGADVFNYKWDNGFQLCPGSNAKIPYPWNTTFLSKIHDFVYALAAKYGTNSTVSFVKMLSPLQSDTSENYIPHQAGPNSLTITPSTTMCCSPATAGAASWTETPTSITGNGTIATVVLHTIPSNGLTVGQLFSITGATPSGFNAANTSTISSVLSTTSFTYANTTTGSASITGSIAGYCQSSITFTSNNDVANWLTDGYSNANIENAWDTIAGYYASAFGSLGKFAGEMLPGGFPSVDNSNNLILPAPTWTNTPTSVTGNGTDVTVVLSSTPTIALAPNQYFTLSGSSVSGYDVIDGLIVSVVNPTTFTYANTTTGITTGSLVAGYPFTQQTNPQGLLITPALVTYGGNTYPTQFMAQNDGWKAGFTYTGVSCAGGNPPSGVNACTNSAINTGYQETKALGTTFPTASVQALAVNAKYMEIYQTDFQLSIIQGAITNANNTLLGLGLCVVP